MTSTIDGTVLLDARGLGLHDGGPLEVIEPDIVIDPKPDGFDITYTFHNDLDVEMPLGRFKLGVFPIGQEIQFREFRWMGDVLTANVDDWNGATWRYPLSLYSPVHVIQNDTYAVGISIQYPVMEYKHDVSLNMVSPIGQKAIGPGGQGWALITKLNNFGNENEDAKMIHPGSILPGETRTYVVSVRVTDKVDEWIRTLVPYRDFFNETYGGVRYARDPRPSHGFLVAESSEVHEDNPDGWTSQNELRPDLYGWLPRVNWMFDREGWERSMIWFPGGVYDYDREEPFDFVTNWLGHDKLMEAVDPNLGLHQVELNGRQLGLWWSQSVNYSESFGNLVGFDITNPDHVEAAFAELDLAVATGATMIGLDTFTHKKCPNWDLYEWLQILQARYPGVNFVVEPLTMDFMHTLAPTHYTGHDDRFGLPENIEDIWAFTTPHFLADFLNPGHEIWGHYRYWAYQFYDVDVTPELVLSDMQKIADLGMVPSIQIGMEIDLDGSYLAKETWLETVPDDLLVFAPPKNPFEATDSINPDTGCLVDMDGDGQLTIADFVQFQSLYKNGNIAADLNEDGNLDIFDFVLFQDLFKAGC